MIDIKYQVLDQGGATIASSAMIPHEKGVLFSGTPYDNNGGPSRISDTSEYTAADGTYHDAPVRLLLHRTFQRQAGYARRHNRPEHLLVPRSLSNLHCLVVRFGPRNDHEWVGHFCFAVTTLASVLRGLAN
jgi:hypothetical protein